MNYVTKCATINSYYLGLDSKYNYLISVGLDVPVTSKLVMICNRLDRRKVRNKLNEGRRKNSDF